MNLWSIKVKMKNLTILQGISVLLFDLDNTLIFMDENQFVTSYASNAALYFKDIFPNSKDFIFHLLEGTKYMVSTNSNQTNIEKFFEYFLPKCNGLSYDVIYKRFYNFYMNDFDNVRNIIQTDAIVPKIFEKVIEKGYKIVIATDPLFPEIATKKRIIWAGLEKYLDKITLITHGEQFKASKVRSDYYRQITEMIHAKPDECLMIGNDFFKDGLASTIGMKYFQIVSETDETSFLNEQIKNKELKGQIKVSGTGTLDDFFKLINN